MATNIYDATTTAINSQMRLAHEQVAVTKNAPMFAEQSDFPILSEVKVNTVVAKR
jgi:NAD(P)H-quinone oxidoreductase subunit 4